jgi:hypothetical protein
MATFLVLATYNPSGYSYAHWLFGSAGGWLGKVVVGLSLAILYATFALATLRSLGRIGVIVWTLLLSTFVWLLIDIGLIERLTAGTIATLGLLVVANVMAVGLSWSYVRARLSGQADTNNVTLP